MRRIWISYSKDWEGGPLLILFLLLLRNAAQCVIKQLRLQVSDLPRHAQRLGYLVFSLHHDIARCAAEVMTKVESSLKEDL